MARRLIISAKVNESKNVGDSALDNARNAEPKTFARVIFDRIATLERTRLQTQFLLALSALPVWEQLVFRGAVAIHGVWLHGRCSQDLDFVAPSAIKKRFVEIVAEQGMTLQKPEEARIPYFAMQGTVFKDIAIGIDVCERELADMNPIRAVFTGAGGVKIPVNVMPLPALMAEKLRATSRRARPSDFFDLWLFGQKHPEMLPALQRHLSIGEVDGEELEYSAEETWTHFLEAEEWWNKGLIASVSKVPLFETVRPDMERFLENLSAIPTTGTHK